MSDKKAKNYIKGSVREAAFARNTGDILNIDLYVPELEAIANEAGYAKVSIYRRKEIDDYGNTHYMFENTFVPDKNYVKDKPAEKTPNEAPKASGGTGGDMPWDKE